MNETCLSWWYLPVAKLTWPAAHLVTFCENSEFQRPKWIRGSWHWAYREEYEGFKFDWGIRVDWIWNKISANFDRNEQRAITLGQWITFLLDFLVWEDSKRKQISLLCDYFQISSVTHENSLSWRNRKSLWCLVLFLLLAVVYNKYSPTHWY
jgi:hypothetical protein